jgi:hypothetical protein
MTEWEDVRAPDDGDSGLVVVLSQRFTRSLQFSLREGLVQSLGWQVGDRIGLQWRRDDARLLLRLAPAANGWQLTRAQKGKGARLQCLPPPPLEGLVADSLPAQWQRDGAGMVVEAPWDLSEDPAP